MLRDASEPRRTLVLSDRAENLEAIENRLKNDILQEALRYAINESSCTEVIINKYQDMGVLFSHIMKSVRQDLNNRIFRRLNSIAAAAESGEGAILPTWTAVDTNNVKTSRELWAYMKQEGWNVDVCFSYSCRTYPIH